MQDKDTTSSAAHFDAIEVDALNGLPRQSVTLDGTNPQTHTHSQREREEKGGANSSESDSQGLGRMDVTRGHVSLTLINHCRVKSVIAPVSQVPHW